MLMCRNVHEVYFLKKVAQEFFYRMTPFFLNKKILGCICREGGMYEQQTGESTFHILNVTSAWGRE